MAADHGQDCKGRLQHQSSLYHKSLAKTGVYSDAKLSKTPDADVKFGVIVTNISVARRWRVTARPIASQKPQLVHVGSPGRANSRVVVQYFRQNQVSAKDVLVANSTPHGD
jgi:hypothetical protein